MKNENQNQTTAPALAARLSESCYPFDGNEYPEPMFLADELDCVTGDIEDKTRRIGEMIDAIRDRHETRHRAGLETDKENSEAREVLVGALITLELALDGIKTVEKWTGADCLS